MRSDIPLWDRGSVIPVITARYASLRKFAAHKAGESELFGAAESPQRNNLRFGGNPNPKQKIISRIFKKNGKFDTL